MEKVESCEGEVIQWAIAVAAVIATALACCGCSFRIETGWHGLTGRDDRTQTQLVRDNQEKETR